MIKILYLKNKEIDKVRWDKAINNAINGNLYAYAGYLDIVSPDWEALISDDYTSVFPLTFKTKYGVKYLCQPPFTQQLGLFSSFNINKDILNQFLKKIPTKFKLIEINLNTAISETVENFYSIPNATYELDLINSLANMQKAYSDNLKRNLKKAQSAQLRLTESLVPQSVINLFKENRGKDINTLNDASYKILKMLMEAKLQNNQGELIGVVDENNDLNSAAFFVTGKGKSVFLFSALSEKGKQNAAMPFIINSFIEKNAEKDLILDFEGSNDENLARFYKSFGAKKNTYLHLSLNKMPYFVKLLFKLYKRIKNH